MWIPAGVYPGEIGAGMTTVGKLVKKGDLNE